MGLRHIRSICIASVVLTAFLSAASPTKGEGQKLAAPQIASLAREATVQIRALDAQSQVVASGSGFIVSEDGIVVTNFHVIQSAAALQVELTSGEVYDNVFFITADPRRDLAIMKIPAERLKPLQLGDDRDAAVGDSVYVMGNPLGLTNTFSDGIVSATRTVEGVLLLQITAPISTGSSGGPVMGASGEVIGIATLSNRIGQNLNYAVPVRYIRPLLSTGERPQRFRASVLPVTTGGLLGTGPTPSATESSAGNRSGVTGSSTAEDRWRASAIRLLANFDSLFLEKQFARTSLETGSLRRGQTQTLTTSLSGATIYGALGVCDGDCSDLDLAVYDTSGALVKSDVNSDDSPLVLFLATSPGTYSIKVSMVTCSVEPCRYGVALYKQGR